jgi:hypothetical protein
MHALQRGVGPVSCGRELEGLSTTRLATASRLSLSVCLFVCLSVSLSEALLRGASPRLSRSRGCCLCKCPVQVSIGWLIGGSISPCDGCDHIIGNTPKPIRTSKLSPIEPLSVLRRGTTVERVVLHPFCHLAVRVVLHPCCHLVLPFICPFKSARCGTCELRWGT